MGDFAVLNASFGDFPVLSEETLIDARVQGELRSHLNDLIIFLPDSCPKAGDVTLSFLSILVDAELVFRFIVERVIGKFGRSMLMDAGKFRLLRRLLVCRYPDKCLHLLYNGFRGINLTGWPDKYKEEQRKHDQATYARRFKVTHQQIFGVFNKVVETGFRSRKRKLISPGKLLSSAWLQQQQIKRKGSRIIRLTHVAITIPEKPGEFAVGTLKVCGSELVYMATGIHVYLSFENIKYAFFRLGDEESLPLLLFNLHNPIRVGTGNTKDISFCLQYALGGMRSIFWDSDKIELEKKFMLGGRNIDLNNFIDEVGHRLTSQLKPLCRFEELDKNYEFDGVLSSTRVCVALTYISLVVFAETELLVIPLRDIEVVNLAEPRHWATRGEIHMTVICQDFKVNSVLEFSQVPIESIPAIKRRLNDSFVKYYVNNEELDWKSVVEGIAESPAKFMENGGWNFYKLEDSHTLAYYKETDIDPVCAAIEEC